MGVIVDSSVFIDGERRGHQSAREIFASIFAYDVDWRVGMVEVGMSVITLMQLAHGIHRANTPQRKWQREQFVDELRNAVPIYPVTEQIALRAALIDATTKAQGNSIALPDLLIGTTALEFGDIILTANVRHFRMIPDLGVVTVVWQK